MNQEQSSPALVNTQNGILTYAIEGATFECLNPEQARVMAAIAATRTSLELCNIHVNDFADDIDALSSEKEDLEDEVRGLRGELEELEADKDSIEVDIETATEQLEDVTRQLTATIEQEQELTKRLAARKRRLRILFRRRRNSRKAV